MSVSSRRGFVGIYRCRGAEGEFVLSNQMLAASPSKSATPPVDLRSHTEVVAAAAARMCLQEPTFHADAQSGECDEEIEGETALVQSARRSAETPYGLAID